jgi:hypothetical protein
MFEVLDVLFCSVAEDPYVLGLPDPHLDPLVRGKDPDPSCHQAKMVSTTLIPTVLRLLYDFLSSKNDVNVPSKSIKPKKIFSSRRSLTKMAGSGSISQRYGSADPDTDSDSCQNLMDPQDCSFEDLKLLL